ncbi:unnamed protein product [Miscanthus lutarioriparius]|uniref:Uncharacterized protein n=1 Tax=Miscanthus lutarioriparius TaxID=422564 RepID=A0A811NGZ7_9POAL|nr:unnamed protein product [Miscanthus lutarioriparius]
MASPGDEGLPALPPIKTTPLPPPPPPPSSAMASASTSPSPASSSSVDSAKAAEEEEEDHEPSTPTSEGSKLRSPAECPPAPRKPPAPRLPVKRKPPLPSPGPARVFVAVPRDLSTVFRALPPKKRIRVS